MIVKNNERDHLFKVARDLSDKLGGPFEASSQPCQMTSDDLFAEIDRARKAQQEASKKFNRYIGHLGMMICFPDEKRGDFDAEPSSGTEPSPRDDDAPEPGM